MIISASRRTDVPALYSEWFYNRVKDGFVHARNPVNRSLARRISLKPEDVTGIVFWTKNPSAMLGRLDELKNFEYYFQFTLTPYGRDVEPNLPDVRVLTDTFKRLSERVGPGRIILRYDPILFNERYDMTFHERAFERTVRELRGFTHKVTISFIDEKYRGVKANLRELRLIETSDAEKLVLCHRFAEIARDGGVEIDSCAGRLDLNQFGIGPAKCVDASYFTKASDNDLNTKAKNQRPGCGCAPSADVGAYNTCVNGCLYCYANYIKTAAVSNHGRHDPLSSFISP